MGDEPEGVIVESGGKRVWVTSEADGAVFVADLEGKKVSQADQGRAAAAIGRVSARTTRARTCPSENGGTLTMIDTKKIAPIKTINLG